jgi:hypothetical protein
VNTKEWRTASLSTLKTMWEGASGMIAGRELVPWATVEKFISERFKLLPVESTCTEGAQKVSRSGPVRFLRTLLGRRVIGERPQLLRVESMAV